MPNFMIMAGPTNKMCLHSGFDQQSEASHESNLKDVEHAISTRLGQLGFDPHAIEATLKDMIDGKYVDTKIDEDEKIGILLGVHATLISDRDSISSITIEEIAKCMQNNDYSEREMK